MIRMALGLSAYFLLHAAQCWGQGMSRMDSIPCDSMFQGYEFQMDIPVGQTFVNRNDCQAVHKVRFHAPSNGAITHLKNDTMGRALRTRIAMMSSNTTTYMGSYTNTAGSMQVKMRGSMSVNEDPTQYLTELRPAINQPLFLNMQLGHGSAWLDLSDLRVRKVNIESNSADVFLTYKKPNPEKMEMLRLTSGMSKIVFRNLEYARADKIMIENGMGDTKIIIGKKLYKSSNLQVGVGAGGCVMMVHEDVPMKLVLENGLFSTVEIPEGVFYETSDNVYVNLAYKANPSKYVTAVIDLGMGSFALITYGDPPAGNQ